MYCEMGWRERCTRAMHGAVRGSLSEATPRCTSISMSRSHICLLTFPFFSTAPTGTLTMPFWCTFDKVARHANLTEPPASLMVPKLGKSVCNNDHAFLYVSCSVNTQGSALHLAALAMGEAREVRAGHLLRLASRDHSSGDPSVQAGRMHPLHRAAAIARRDQRILGTLFCAGGHA